MPARRRYRAALVSRVSRASGVVLGLALALGGEAACTDGTTPDCSDAQCGVLPEAGEAGDSALADVTDDAAAADAASGDAAPVDAAAGDAAPVDAASTREGGGGDAARD